jgi:predicted glycosyltransferase
LSARVLFYVQHLLGIGHLRRAAIIAQALARQGLNVSFVAGGAPAGDLDFARSGIELVQLPPALSADAQFSAIHDEHGKPIDDGWRRHRKRLLLDAFAARRPDLLLIEMFPFGRRQFAFELEPVMMMAKDLGVPVAVSLRDILVAKDKPARTAETVSRVNQFVDAVLVHGDPDLIRLEATFPAVGDIRPPVIYTGYVAEADEGPATPPAEGEEILVSVGGGAVGGPLLRAALAARPMTSLARAPWRLIAGPNLPESEFAGLAANLQPGVMLERFRTDFRELLAASRLSLSQAGYNTIMDILGAGARALVLPFAEGAESEQTLRARLLAARGLLSLAEPPFEPAPLARAIEAALARPRPGVDRIDCHGAEASAGYLKRLLESTVPSGGRVRR